MPTVNEQAYIAYCGCTLENIGVACQNCLNCTTHCQCTECRACHNSVFEQEICTSCNRCLEYGCCRCYECNSCGLRRDNVPCDRCANCESCCRCFLCQTCNVRFREREQRANFHDRCNRCFEHCQCFICRTCRVGTNARNFCPTCSRCLADCGCTVCRCGRRSAPESLHSCGSGRCVNCCPCEATGVSFRPGKFQLFTSQFSKGEFKRNTNRRHISVELEVDQFNAYAKSKDINIALLDWQDAVVQDGSIPGGFEINTNPTNGDLFLKHIRELTDGLGKIGAGCSNACGMHVHVNCKGSPLFDRSGNPIKDRDGNQRFDKADAFTGYDLRRLVVLYAKIEKAFFELCHPRRITSRYSVPCGAYYLAKDDLTPKKFRQNMVSQMYRGGASLVPAANGTTYSNEELRRLRTLGIDPAREVRTRTSVVNRNGRTPRPSNPAYRSLGDAIKRAKNHKYEQARYKALNLHSFFMRGTVEFRHHEGTVDFDEITNFALTCATVVDKAAKMTDSEIKSLPKLSRDALLSILPSELQQYAQDRWRENEKTIPRYRETVKDAWRGQPNNDEE